MIDQSSKQMFLNGSLKVNNFDEASVEPLPTVGTNMVNTTRQLREHRSEVSKQMIGNSALTASACSQTRLLRDISRSANEMPNLASSWSFGTTRRQVLPKRTEVGHVCLQLQILPFRDLSAIYLPSNQYQAVVRLKLSPNDESLSYIIPTCDSNHF